MAGIRKHAYRGYLKDVSKMGDYGFIAKNSIARADGKSLNFLPKEDLMAHVKFNRDLGDPLPNGVWVRFWLDDDPNPHRKGQLCVCKGKLDQ